MTALPEALAGGRSRQLAARRTGRGVLRWAHRNPVGVLALAVLLIVAAAAAAAPLIAPHAPNALDPGRILARPSASHPAGTDQFGRDVLSRVIYGARASLIIGMTAVIAGPAIGLIIGAFSGYLGGTWDLLLQRVVDALISFPLIVMALLVIAATGVGTLKIALAISIVIAPRAIRLARASTLSVAANDYVYAARAVGAGHVRTVFVHILPGILAPIVVLATAELGVAIIAEASLSFLGFGVPPPTPSWGEMIQNGRKFITTAPWLGLYPGLAITLTVLAANLFGDAMRDLLDPRLRNR